MATLLRKFEEAGIKDIARVKRVHTNLCSFCDVLLLTFGGKSCSVLKFSVRVLGRSCPIALTLRLYT